MTHGREEDWGDSSEWSQPGHLPTPPAGPGRPAQSIPTYLLPAVLVTLFCFLPTGIAAIVFANQVTSKLQAGDIGGAQKASRNARLWVIISVVAGLLVGACVLSGLLNAASSRAVGVS